MPTGGLPFGPRVGTLLPRVCTLLAEPDPL